MTMQKIEEEIRCNNRTKSRPVSDYAFGVM